MLLLRLGLPPPLLLALLLLLFQLEVASECHLKISKAPLPSVKPRNIGFLIGVGPDTPDESITELAPHVVRGPFASQPYWTRQAERLAGLGIGSLQLILGPQILETRWVSAKHGRNNSALRAACWPSLKATCPLPGSVADPHLDKWATAVGETVEEVEKLGLADRIVYDICELCSHRHCCQS